MSFQFDKSPDEVIDMLSEKEGKEAEEAADQSAEEEQEDFEGDEAEEHDSDSSEPAEDDTTYAEEQSSEPGPIPYERFKTVNEERKLLREQFEQLNAQHLRAQAQAEAQQAMFEQMMARFGQTAQQPKPQPQQADDLSWLFDDEEGADQQPALDPRIAQTMNSLVERQHQMEMAVAQRELALEIARAKAKYPDVPESYLVDAVANDGGVSVEHKALEIHNWLQDQKARAVEQYLAQGGETAHDSHAARKAPPRPRKAGTNTSARGGQKKKPQSLAEAREMALAAIQNGEL